jgi:hypothetical protein
MKTETVANTRFLDLHDESHEESFLAALDGTTATPRKRIITASDLRLVNKKISLRYCEYKITNMPNKMMQTDSVSISAQGLMIHSPVPFSPGTLMRVLLEVPDYWGRKSRHVQYRHTNAPTCFQVLSRILSCEDLSKRTAKFQLLCENVNMDSIDELVLNEFLGVDHRHREA